MADKPASGIPQDDDVTASKETSPETVVSTPEEVTPAVSPSKPEESASKSNEAPPDINASKIEEATPSPPPKPFEVSKEPCNRVTAPPPMKSCSCTPKPSLREAFQAALHKLCPKSRSASKTAVVTLDQRKHMDKDSGTQTPPVEVCLKSKDYSNFDGCRKRSGDDVAKIDSYPAEKLVTKVNTNNNNAKENVPEKPKDVPKDVTPKNVTPKDETPKDVTPKDASPKEKEVEKKTELELPPCPYPCTPVDTYKKYYDTAPKGKETVVQDPGAKEPKLQEPAAKEAMVQEPGSKEPEPLEPSGPTAENQAEQGLAVEESKAPAPPLPETVVKKPSRSHCKKTSPQTEFCGYRKDKEEGK